ncbi:unnamed protein product (macronuclear) [Paramecium tetraurelia]|uniref:DUF4378 domain-containing protein n=1 Tax=Paramecium tetraurelia TaxID=5888 RepID=A0DJZ4_PARTE|nr:uncharacterized protein GSPATT00017705001 [Paramecium tetraurelia]CAK83361.1 unnamed protein product [Paramecium tetraurelia]|eukprot:XP_001450758.1 hypothetical protein (macronuclear) [Paramecium tetraurelia strain d4-2]
MQGQQGKVYKKKKSLKSTQKFQEIAPISTQRTLKTTDQILSQRSPITGTTKSTKNTIETKRTMSPEELKSSRKSNKPQKNQEGTKNPNQSSPLFTEKQQRHKKQSLQQFIKEKKQSEVLQERLLQQKIQNDQQKKLLNLQKLKLKTKKIFGNAKKAKQKMVMKNKLKKYKINEIIERFQEISKRYEKIQIDQISQFQSEVNKHQQSYKTQTENQIQMKIMEEVQNEFYQNQAATLIQHRWKDLKKNKEKQNYSQTKLQQISLDWEPKQQVSQQVSPTNFEDGFLFSQGGDKQTLISNIRSSTLSEESSPIVNQLNQEFENWNLFIQRIVQNTDISNINKQMQQQIISIIQNHKLLSENISERKSENQINQEKSTTSHQKKLSEDLTKNNVLQLQQRIQQEENLISKYREEAIYLRYDVELKQVAEKHHYILQEWLNKELEDLKNTRKAFEIGHMREITTLKKIQRDILVASAELSSDQQYSLQIQQIQEYIDEQFNGLKDKQQNYQSQQEIQKNVDLVTTEILNEMMIDISEEMLNNREDLYLIISNLIANQEQTPCVPTSMSDISQYIDNLFKYILENYKQSLIENLNTPFGFTPKQRLKIIHGNEDCDFDIDNDHEDFQTSIAFPIDEGIFVEQENKRIPETDNNNDEVECAILELQHIHNKAIFDACNEALNSYRPYYYNSGIKYPWERSSLNLQRISNENLVQILEKVKSVVLKQSKVLCGFYEPEEFENVKQEKQEIIDEKNLLMLMQQLNLVENPLLVDTNIQFDNLTLIRDEQLYKLLVEDLKQQEYKWNLIEDDRTEYLMEVSDQILEYLIEEFQKEM